MGTIGVVPLEFADLEDEFHISGEQSSLTYISGKILELVFGAVSTRPLILPHISGVAHATLRHRTDTLDNEY